VCFKGKGGGENTTSANRDVGGCQQEICVRCGGAQSLSIWGSTRAVGVAVVAALAVLGTTVPARTLGHFLGQLADLGLCVKHVALGTTKLVWLLVVIAGEVVLAVSGMSIDGVRLQQVLGSDGVPASWAGEPVHLQKLLGVVAYSRQLTLLL